MRCLKSQKIPHNRRKKHQRNPVTRVRRPYRRDGRKRNTPKTMPWFYMYTYLCHMLDDAHQKCPLYGRVDNARDKKTLFKRISCEGVMFATSTLPDLCSYVLNALETGQHAYPGFKTRGGLPVFLGGLLRVVFGNDVEEMDQVNALKCIYAITNSFKKIHGPFKKAGIAKQFSDFLKVDAELPVLDFRDPILITARRIIASLIENLTLDDPVCVPRPGPGSTNSPTEKHERFEAHVIYQQLDEVLPVADWFYPTRWDVVENSRNYLALKRKLRATSRTKYVPKKYGKGRGICLEEHEVQFLQQAIARLLRFRVLDTLKPFIDLSKQAVNAILALTSSLTRKFATLDMSEASDRVLRMLVAFMFCDNEELLDALLACSTEHVTAPKEIDPNQETTYQVRKFAPMGSALCFPVMTLVHYALIRAIILHEGKADCVAASHQVYVYGDDILVKSEYAPVVMHGLERYGMKINATKSFYRGHFRESCGTHAYKGVCITPCFVKHTPSHTTPEALASIIANENHLYYNGFLSTARFLRDTTKAMFRLPLEVVEQGLSLIGWQRNDVNRCIQPQRKTKWNWDLQRWMHKLPVFERTKKQTLIEGTPALLRYWCNNVAIPGAGSWKHKLFPKSGLDSELVYEAQGDLRITWRWV